MSQIVSCSVGIRIGVQIVIGQTRFMIAITLIIIVIQTILLIQDTALYIIILDVVQNTPNFKAHSSLLIIYYVLLLIHHIKALFLLVQPMLMTTIPTWFILSLAINVNFNMQEKHPKILIKYSIDIILTSGTLLHILSVKS